MGLMMLKVAYDWRDLNGQDTEWFEFKDNTGKIKVIDAGQEETQRSFAFPTTVGLHDERGRLLAVAKMSRPIEKNDEKDITFRIRLDF